jgi:hypothetical protein
MSKERMTRSRVEVGLPRLKMTDRGKEMKRNFKALIITASVGLALGIPALVGAATTPGKVGLEKPKTGVFCHDEFICTPMNGCRWITICN